MCHSGSGILDLYDIVDALRSMTISDANNLEVNLILDLTRARQDVVNAEKVLADCVVHKHKVLANLSKHKSDILKQKLAKVDVGIAHMRITFQKHGLSHHRPTQSVLQESLKCHHIMVQLY
ncbi:uncharacterized protein BJ212DRAFT_1301274 [Suillus subaureus]|uniref:Uncharacterized protein n=1 Tax=Suillus subaureus TaxID=48587 RepID=A0A9P7E7J3_9AGAM|nr:uncharacterized protein BJ212DRAFT_1301274 [Suillus subaureus]KAG1812782.1 hypothetical protein BJ212DRAFT_1301274 [Suillus subaureus]